MRRYNLKNDNLKIKVREVTLLSEAELTACRKYIDRNSYSEPWYIYLLTPHENNKIGLAECFGYFEVSSPTDPDLEDCWNVEDENGDIIQTVYGTGIRPALKIESEKIGENIILKPLDKVMIGKDEFTYISQNILLRDHCLFDGYTYGIFDENTNDYEKSSAKKQVDEWFFNDIEPNLQ